MTDDAAIVTDEWGWDESKPNEVVNLVSTQSQPSHNNHRHRSQTSLTIAVQLLKTTMAASTSIVSDARDIPMHLPIVTMPYVSTMTTPTFVTEARTAFSETKEFVIAFKTKVLHVSPHAYREFNSPSLAQLQDASTFSMSDMQMQIQLFCSKLPEIWGIVHLVPSHGLEIPWSGGGLFVSVADRTFGYFDHEVNNSLNQSVVYNQQFATPNTPYASAIKAEAVRAFEERTKSRTDSTVRMTPACERVRGDAGVGMFHSGDQNILLPTLVLGENKMFLLHTVEMWTTTPTTNMCGTNVFSGYQNKPLKSWNKLPPTLMIKSFADPENLYVVRLDLDEATIGNSTACVACTWTIRGGKMTVRPVSLKGEGDLARPAPLARLRVSGMQLAMAM